jgi:Tfp pilus assembly protein PilV
MFIRPRKLAERGDTIVEVLISIAVISMALGGAFVTTNRSLQGTRQAQERVNATKLVEGQLEQLRAVAASNSAYIFGAGVPASYCISGSIALPANPVVSSSNAACAVNTSGTPSSVEPVFHLSISRSGNTFTVNNTWYNVHGTQDHVVMEYRLYD